MFHYIEHGILIYDFVYEIDMYMFQVLPLFPWSLIYPRLNTVMYFGHRFPLISHIRGHLLSCKMALLHPSIDIQYVETQKEKLD